MNQNMELGLEDSEDEDEEEELPVENEGPVEDAHNNEANNENEAEDFQITAKKTKSARKRVIRNPQIKLDSTRLSSERGIPTLAGIFCKLNWKGKGHELADLQKLMQNLEHWCHRLYPRLPFDDVLERIEQLGKKKEMKVCISKVRLDIPLLTCDVDQVDDDVPCNDSMVTDPEKEWNEMIKEHGIVSTQSEVDIQARFPRSPLKQLSQEQLKLIEENRLLAKQCLAAKMKVSTSQNLDSSQNCLVDGTSFEYHVSTEILNQGAVNAKNQNCELVQNKSLETSVVQNVDTVSTHNSEFLTLFENMEGDFTPLQIMDIDNPVQNIKTDDNVIQGIKSESILNQSMVSDNPLIQSDKSESIPVQNIESNNILIQSMEIESIPIQSLKLDNTIIQNIEPKSMELDYTISQSQEAEKSNMESEATVD